VKTVQARKSASSIRRKVFSATETDFAWKFARRLAKRGVTPEEDPIIFNLPNTVELMMPNQHADQIEWFITHQKISVSAHIKLHTHNDRGTGIAASELGLLAGANAASRGRSSAMANGPAMSTSSRSP